MKRILHFSTLILALSCIIALFSCGDDGHTHQFGNWEITAQAGCETEGSKTRKCSCGEFEIAPIAAVGHSMSDWDVVVAPTCSSDGERVRSCTLCGEEVETEVVAGGHQSSAWIIEKKASCLTPGSQTRGCTVCGAVLEKEVIPALGHSCEVYDTYNYDATADKDGTVSGKCTVCKKTATKVLEGSSALLVGAFGDKTISVLGDSISTYLNVSNGAAADTTNSTIRDGVLYYDAQKIEYMGVTLQSTWWQRTADTLGASILVNNSWSGSYIKDASTNTLSTPGAYLERAVNLHDNTGENAGEEPDIIFVYMGTNDYYKYGASIGVLSDSLYASLPDKLGSDYTATSVAEAYAIMIYKIAKEYENAEIYCLNVLEGPSTDGYALSVFNGMIKDVCEHFGAHYVDICAYSGIKSNPSYGNYIPSDDGDGTKNTLHPNSAGMALISDYLIEVIFKNSKYYPDMTELMD